MSLCDREGADAATGTVVVALVQTYYGVVSEKSREHFAAQRRARNRKAYLCIYSQLCVFESESYFGNLTDAMKARSYAFQDADDFPNYAKQQGVTHLTKSVRVHAERVPQLPWDLQREFFESYCGVPELLMMTSRQFQHDAFQRDMEDVFSLGRKAYVGVCVSCSNGRGGRSRVDILVLCIEGGMLSMTCVFVVWMSPAAAVIPALRAACASLRRHVKQCTRWHLLGTAMEFRVLARSHLWTSVSCWGGEQNGNYSVHVVVTAVVSRCASACYFGGAV